MTYSSFIDSSFFYPILLTPTYSEMLHSLLFIQSYPTDDAQYLTHNIFISFEFNSSSQRKQPQNICCFFHTDIFVVSSLAKTHLFDGLDFFTPLPSQTSIIFPLR